MTQSITLPAPARLIGSVSDDGIPGQAVTVTWIMMEGPGSVSFETPDSPSTMAVFSAPGTYTLRLIASDSVLTTTADVAVTVNSAESQPENSIGVNPGDNLQSAADQHPAGTTFYLRAGTYRMQSVRPKDGTVFLGAPGAVLNGARLLTDFSREGNYWLASGQTQENPARPGPCQPQRPRCNFAEDLFLDNEPLEHVDSLSKVAVGKWYFDYSQDKIYFITFIR